jgi:hypothetical protein
LAKVVSPNIHRGRGLSVGTAVAAGVDTTFQPRAHGIHVWPVFISAGIPESALAIEDVASFFKLHARSDTVEEAAS